VVVGRRADAAEAEHDVARCQGAPERRRDAFRLVAEVLAPGEAQPAPRQRLDEPREVLVLALADEDLVADDESAEAAYQYPRPQ